MKDLDPINKERGYQPLRDRLENILYSERGKVSPSTLNLIGGTCCLAAGALNELNGNEIAAGLFYLAAGANYISALIKIKKD